MQTYQEYLENQRKKYARKKPYFNFFKVYENGYSLFAYRSPYDSNVVVSNDPTLNYENHDEVLNQSYFSNSYTKGNLKKSRLESQKHEKEILEWVKSFIPEMENEKYKSCSNSTCHFSIHETWCYRLRVQDANELYPYQCFEIDELYCNIKKNEHCCHAPEEHARRVGIVKNILFKIPKI